MSDSSIVLCVEGHVDNNEVLAANVIRALQHKKNIQSDLTDCALEGLGYGKGKNFSKAVQCPEERNGLNAIDRHQRRQRHITCHKPLCSAICII